MENFFLCFSESGGNKRLCVFSHLRCFFHPPDTRDYNTLTHISNRTNDANGIVFDRSKLRKRDIRRARKWMQFEKETQNRLRAAQLQLPTATLIANQTSLFFCGVEKFIIPQPLTRLSGSKPSLSLAELASAKKDSCRFCFIPLNIKNFKKGKGWRNFENLIEFITVFFKLKMLNQFCLTIIRLKNNCSCNHVIKSSDNITF